MSVTVIRDADRDWREVSAEWPGKAKPGEPSVAYKMLMPSAPGRPNMQRSRFDPLHFEPPHTHPEDEVIYLLQGEISFGAEILSAGDALFVPKDTRYSLRAGAQGAEFLRVGLPQTGPEA